MAEKAEEIKFILTAKDASHDVRERFVRETIAAMKRINQQSAASAISSGNRSGGAALLGGGGSLELGAKFALVGAAFKSLEAGSDAFIKAKGDIDIGRKGWGDLSAEVALSIPILGNATKSLATFTANLASFISGADSGFRSGQMRGAAFDAMREQAAGFSGVLRGERDRQQGRERQVAEDAELAGKSPSERAQILADRAYREEVAKVNATARAQRTAAEAASRENMAKARAAGGDDAQVIAEQARKQFETQQKAIEEVRRQGLAAAARIRQTEYNQTVRPAALAEYEAEQKARQEIQAQRIADAVAADRAVFDARIKTMEASGQEHAAALAKIARDEQDAINAAQAQYASGIAGLNPELDGGAIAARRATAEKAIAAIRESFAADRANANKADADRRKAAADKAFDDRLEARRQQLANARAGNVGGIPLGGILDAIGEAAAAYRPGGAGPASLSGTAAIDGRGLTGVGSNLEAGVARSQLEQAAKAARLQEQVLKEQQKATAAIVETRRTLEKLLGGIGNAA